MDRADLTTPEAQKVICEIDDLIKALNRKGLSATSWYGEFPPEVPKKGSGRAGLMLLAKRLLRRNTMEVQRRMSDVDRANRGPDYTPLPGAVDDISFPWYLYWEIYWVLKNCPALHKDMKLLDAGGASSLFTCYLASLGHEVHSIDLNPVLIENGNKTARKMGWNLHSYHMNMKHLDFPNGYFDHAFSICVFEHLALDLKHKALSELARCLKPGGTLSITFDFRNPAPSITEECVESHPEGLVPTWETPGSTRSSSTVVHFKEYYDDSEANQISTPDDIRRNFLATDDFGLRGNQGFVDNGKSYLVNHERHNVPYTFGSICLKKK